MTREEAIKTLDDMWKMITSAYDDIADSHVAAYTMAVDALKAQADLQQSCNQLATDTISRQAAIDEIEERKNANGYRNVAVISELNRLEGYIMRLPSAQQEIICCKDCKHRGEKPINDGRYWCSFHDTFMYYCSDAERRTDE